MNLLGRLFIVLIFIGSIMLMSWSVALYATHKNWRADSARLQEQLDAKTRQFNDLQTQKNAMESAMTLEINSQVARNGALRERVDLLIQENDTARQELAALTAERDAQTALVANVTTETQELRTRLEKENAALLYAQYEWIAMSTELIKQMDLAQSLAIQNANLRAIGAQLAKDFSDVVAVLRANGWTGDPALYASQPPAGIRGTVTEIRPGGFIEISIGRDSGLVKGHQLDIVRHRNGRSSIIAKVEITDVAVDRAVAIIMPEFRRGNVQRDDEVTYIDLGVAIVAH
ncbi:MAG: hypothetical protein FWE95_09830 [Planctomycetaceae bacterium]|nr:hypothetical protein [Planctomycetaceae bacterium]